MRLKKNSFVVRVAYWGDKRDSERVSLCTLFWKFVLNIVPFMIVMVLAFGIVIPVLYIIAPFFGCVFAPNNRDVFKPISSWPRVCGWRLLPLPIIILAGVLTLVVWGLWTTGFAVYGRWDEITRFCSSRRNALLVAAGFLTGALILWGVRFSRSETWRVCAAWLKAKKDRVCPLVTIE